MSILSVKNVNKQFGGLKALDEVNRRLGLALELLAEPGRGGYEFRRG